VINSHIKSKINGVVVRGRRTGVVHDVERGVRVVYLSARD